MTGTVLRSLPTLIPDAELLGRFVASRDESAFAELVRRHGPVVYRVCRRIVGPNAADDAFQATFLVLATSGEKVRKAASVGSWLVGVAGRVARQMRRRELRHRPPHPQPLSLEGRGEPITADLATVLDDELTRLPSALRGPVVACLIQHRTHKQAAVELGESERTLRRRLNEAKRLLRMRLERRGVVPAVAAAIVCGVGAASANVPAGLSERTVVLVFDFLAGGVAVASTPAMIAKGVSMTATTRMAKAVLALVAVGLTVVGIGLAGDPPKSETIPPVDRRKPDPKPLNPYFTTYEAQGVEAKTKNFVVTATDPVVARAVANEAEYQRKALAEKWLGKELPAWEKPCVIEVTNDLGHLKGDGSGTEIEFNAERGSAVVIEFNAERRLAKVKMMLFGTEGFVLRHGIPTEIMHVLLAERFGKSWRSWMDTGVALTESPVTNQATYDRMCRDILNDGKGIPLKKLLPMKFDRTAESSSAEWAQGHSLVRFLLSRNLQRREPETDRAALMARDREARLALIAFVADGLKENTTDGWNTSAKTHYGFADVDAMQEAWIGWLKTPGSSLADALPKKPKPAAERKRDESLIPPVKFDKVAPSAPPLAVQVVFACNPELAKLPDPTKDDKPQPGLSGQLSLLAADGSFTTAPGDLYITLETETKGIDGKKLVTEVFHFDQKILAKLMKEERVGDSYALFLPWPPNWPERVDLRVSAQFNPADTSSLKLTSKPQMVTTQKPK